jgi:hypothetical protein
MSEYDPADPNPEYAYQEGAPPAPEAMPARDPNIDEYGLRIPEKTYMEKAADFWTPEPDDPWYEQIGKGFGMAASVYPAYIADGIGQVPILGEMADGEERVRYERQRAAAQEAETAQVQEWYSPESAETPDDAMCPTDNPYQHMAE